MVDYSKVMLATPVRDGRFHTAYVAGLMACNGLHRGWIPYSGQSDIYIARNVLMNTFWQRRAEYDTCVFIDSDIGYSREDLIELLDSEPDVVSGIYTDKCQPPLPFVRDENGDQMLANIPQTGMIKSKLIPGGFFKISIKALERIIEQKLVIEYGDANNKMYAFYTTKFFRNLLVSEDYSLAVLLAEAGIQPWTNCSIRLNHDGRTWDGKITDQLSAKT
jgi:hypothetical protein